MTVNGYEVHPLAEYFPILEGEEFEKLVKDIEENGQNESIVLYKGQILDGVNRMRACEQLGRKPETKEYEGADPLKYVISSNIRRRHLTVSQRSMLATEMLPEFEKKAEETKKQKLQHGGSLEPESYDETRSAGMVGDVFGISRASVRRAKRIKEQAPDKVKDVVYGKTSVAQVDQELRQKEKEKYEQEHPEIEPDLPTISAEEETYITNLQKSILYIKKSPEIVTEEGRKRIVEHWEHIKELVDERLGVENEG
jgi:ParB-like chromosome segregation protein Spo0J